MDYKHVEKEDYRGKKVKILVIESGGKAGVSGFT